MSHNMIVNRYCHSLCLINEEYLYAFCGIMFPDEDVEDTQYYVNSIERTRIRPGAAGSPPQSVTEWVDIKPLGHDQLTPREGVVVFPWTKETIVILGGQGVSGFQ